MATVEKSIAYLERQLKDSGYIFSHLEEKGGVVKVRYGTKYPADTPSKDRIKEESVEAAKVAQQTKDGITAEIAAFEWTEEVESTEERLVRMQAEIDALKKV